MTPNIALAIRVPDSVIYDSTASDHDNLNHMYSLDGIKYDVYKDSSCQTPAKIANTTTNAQMTVYYTAGKDYAESDPIELEPGTYYVRENEASCASKGIAWNKTVKKVVVESSNTEDNPAIVGDSPQTDKVVKIGGNNVMHKLDQITNATPQGNGTLSGCVIRVAYFDKKMTGGTSAVLSRISEAKRVWYFQTDANGKIDLATATPLNSGAYRSSRLYLVRDGGARVFLLGTYYIDEVKAPEGYNLEANPSVVTFEMDNNNLSTNVALGTLTYTTENSVDVGKLNIEKLDAEANADGKGNVCQGDTDHAAIFTVKNASRFPIVFYNSYTTNSSGNLVGVGEGKTIPVGGEIPTKLVCRRNANGDWVSNDLTLPYGTYTVTEDYGGTGMLTDRNWSETVSLNNAHEVETIEVTKTNNPVRAGLKLTKVDSDTVAPTWLFAGGDVTLAQLVDEIATGQGNAHLEGAEFTIKNVSAGPVKVDGTWYNQNDDVAKIVTYVTQTSTGKDVVVANTRSNLTLPYGTYEVRETKAPEGYNAITGLIGGEAVSVHPSESEHGTWYVTGWEIGEV